MLILLLNRPDLAGEIKRNETYNLQNLYGGRVPVLETRYVDEEMGWAGDWVGRVWQWMSANDIFIHGGTYLDLACSGDISLTDIVQGQTNRCIRVGSMCYDVTNLAQIILPDGITFRQEVRKGGVWNTHANSAEWEGLDWPLHIRQALGTGSNMAKLRPEYVLSGKRCGNVWFQLGREVGFGVKNSDLRVGRIVGLRKGWIALDVWIPLEAVRKSTRHYNGLPNWKKPEIAERLTIPDTQAFPLSTTLLNPVEEVYKVEDSAEWIGEWWKQTDPSNDDGMVPEENNEDQVLIYAENEKPWRYDKGKGPETMSPDESNSQTDTLWAMSDGGVTNAGTHCTRAGYGYVIRSNKPVKAWGDFEYSMSGRGMVEGNNLYMDSTRAEARGLLATMTRILSSLELFQKIKQIDHATDNEAVVDIYSGLKERSAADWLRASDSDIWNEIQQAEEKFASKGIVYQVRWVRSHPERRHTWLAEWNVDDVLNSMADSLATLAIQEYVGTGNANLIPARDSKRVWYAYTQAVGGKKHAHHR